jgi:hypothetical protein
MILRQHYLLIAKLSLFLFTAVRYTLTIHRRMAKNILALVISSVREGMKHHLEKEKDLLYEPTDYNLKTEKPTRARLEKYGLKRALPRKTTVSALLLEEL